MPSTVKSAALTAPPPIALYEDGERVVDVERALCLTSLPSVTGIVSVPKAWRTVTRNALDKSWLTRIRDTLIEQLCAQLEELDDAEHTAIMQAFKPQFCVRLIMVYLVCCKQLQAAIGGQPYARLWAMQCALRFSTSTSSDELVSLRTYLSRIRTRAQAGKAKRPSFAHSTILYVRATSYAAETLILLDDDDTKLISRTPTFQDCAFEALNKRVLDAIEAWNRDEPAAKKPKLDGDAGTSMRQNILLVSTKVLRVHKVSGDPEYRDV